MNRETQFLLLFLLTSLYWKFIGYGILAVYKNTKIGCSMLLLGNDNEEKVCNEILELDRSIRFAGIANKMEAGAISESMR